jgi:hypothetical protein
MKTQPVRIVKRWPLLLVAALALALIVVRMAWPGLKFDSTSLTLFAIAGGALLFCYLPLKKLKIGDLEMEVEHLQESIANARQAYSDRSLLLSDAPSEVATLLEKGVDNPEGVFLSLCAAMEVKARERLGDHAGRYLSLEEAVRLGVQQRVFPPDALPAFQQFWRIKQKVVHEQGFRVERPVLMSLIASEIDLLRLMAADHAVAAAVTPPMESYVIPAAR